MNDIINMQNQAQIKNNAFQKIKFDNKKSYAFKS